MCSWMTSSRAATMEPKITTNEGNELMWTLFCVGRDEFVGLQLSVAKDSKPAWSTFSQFSATL